MLIFGAKWYKQSFLVFHYQRILSVAKGAAAVALVLLMASQVEAQSNDRLGADASKTEVKSTPTYSVGVKDMRDQRYEVAQSSAARASNEAIIVFYNGKDIKLFNAVRQGASDAKDVGARVRGIVLGPPVEEGESFVVYTNGQPSSKRVKISSVEEAISMSRGLIEVSEKEDFVTDNQPYQP